MRQDHPRKVTKAGRQHDYERSIRQSLIRSRIGSSQNARIYQTQQATFVNPVDTSSPGGGESTIVAQWFRVKTISFSFLTCRTWEGTTDGDTDIMVAKPQELRGNATRTVTVGSASGIESIFPPYLVNSLIYGLKPEGKTDVSGGGVGFIEWIDANVDARRWDFPQRILSICVNGEPLRMIIRGSVPA